MDDFLTIAMADDDEDDRFFFAEAIEEISKKCRLLFYKNGQQLIDALSDTNSELPDIVFLDLNMPKISGMETLKKIRGHERFKNIPIIAIYSTSSAESDKDQSFKHGANAYLKKPNDFSELKAMLENVLNINWSERKKEEFLIII